MTIKQLIASEEEFFTNVALFLYGESGMLSLVMGLYGFLTQSIILAGLCAASGFISVKLIFKGVICDYIVFVFMFAVLATIGICSNS